MQAEPQRFQLDVNIPEGLPKRVKLFCRTDRVIGMIQVIRKGGENHLHSHAHLDGVWTVLSGRARFYGEGNALIAELGPYEGILIPREFKYWFESASEDEPLVIHQVEASDVPIRSARDLMGTRFDNGGRKPTFEASLEGDFSDTEK